MAFEDFGYLLGPSLSEKHLVECSGTGRAPLTRDPLMKEPCGRQMEGVRCRPQGSASRVVELGLTRYAVLPILVCGITVGPEDQDAADHRG